MKQLIERIQNEGEILNGDILKVDGFLNHQIDIPLIKDIGREFYSLFKEEGVTKILTIEASGIAIGTSTAEVFELPLLYAKKSQSTNLGDNVYTSKVYSYTHNREYTITISKKYIHEDDVFLIVDDFLANGLAITGLIDIVNQANAKIAGIGVCIEKSYQEGGKKIRDLGYRVESLAKIKSMKEGKIEFE